MKNRNTIFEIISLVSQLGISMVTPILLCVLAGIFLKKRFEVEFMIPLIIFGVLAGGRNAYVLVKHAVHKMAQKEDDEE